MFNVIRTRLAQGYRTASYPKTPPQLPDRFTGAPSITPDRCVSGCADCAAVCPANALRCADARPSIDLGACIFCGNCATACPRDVIAFTGEYRLATRTRNDLFRDGASRWSAAAPLEKARLSLFRKSIRLRQVSAGGCNACEADINVLNTPAFDLSRFGIQFVASPRHADGLVITGPVTKNMELALKKTYDATPAPKVVIAVGACAISGGLFADREETTNGVPVAMPVDLYIPGCPPHPYTILDGILRLLDKL